LPPTGGAPIRNESFPWSLVIFIVFSAIALSLGVRAYRRTLLSKK
jgi:ABC-type multidrug transport system permease subunit